MQNINCIIIIYLHISCYNSRFHTASAREWMEIFQNELSSVPVLVCLTHADDIYENCKQEIVPVCPPGMVDEMKRNFQRELEVQCDACSL